MLAEEQTRFLTELAEDLNSRNISLPSFPDVVVNIRTALEDPSCTADRLGDVVRTDAVLVARLLMAANSAFHNRAGIEITDLNLAISRLGFEVVRNTAITLAVEQIFNASQHEDLKERIRGIWSNSLSLASMCFVIARNTGNVNPDNAFLCGLMHEIGKLYILTRARSYPSLMESDESLANVLEDWYASVGKSIVESWGFSSEIAEAMEVEENLSGDGGGTPNLADVLFASRMLLEAEDDSILESAPAVTLDKTTVNADTLPVIREAYEMHSQSMRQSVGR